MGEPELIKTIVKRVFRDLERQHEGKIGGRSPDPCGGTLHTSGPPPLAGRETSSGRLDQGVPSTVGKRLAEKS
jgi:hypothetical protein